MFSWCIPKFTNAGVKIRVFLVFWFQIAIEHQLGPYSTFKFLKKNWAHWAQSSRKYKHNVRIGPLVAYMQAMKDQICLPIGAIYQGLHWNISLIASWKYMLWYSLEAPRRGASNEYHNICFREEVKNIKRVLLKKVSYLQQCNIQSFLSFDSTRTLQKSKCHARGTQNINTRWVSTS